MLKLNRPFEVIFKADWSPRIKKGTVANVDAIKLKKSALNDNSTVCMFRITDIRTRPIWLDCTWFKGLEHIKNLKEK